MEDDRTRFLKILLGMMTQCRGTLQAMVVANKTGWNVNVKYLQHQEMVMQGVLRQEIVDNMY